MELIKNQTKFNRLTYLREDGFKVYKNGRRRKCLFLCECGIQISAVLSNVKYGGTQSCGCLQIESAKKSHITHGNSNSNIYKAYQDAKYRCNNKASTNYKNYGGRGIQFKFKTFEEFFKEVGNKPTPKHTIDRINNNGHYEVGNIRWATFSEQAKNKRTYGKVPHKYISIAYNKFMTRTLINGKIKYIGLFNTLEEAIAARDTAYKQALRSCF